MHKIPYVLLYMHIAMVQNSYTVNSIHSVFTLHLFMTDANNKKGASYLNIHDNFEKSDTSQDIPY